jgi:hypothetical protein
LNRVWLEIHKLKPAPGMDVVARDLEKRSKVLQQAVLESMGKNIWRDKTPPYVPPLPGAKLMFREAMAAERPSPQQWPHRLYAELVHADRLPANLANMVCDTMRAHIGNHTGGGRQCGPGARGRPLDSRLYLLWLCIRTAAPRSHRGVPAVPVFAPFEAACRKRCNYH